MMMKSILTLRLSLRHVQENSLNAILIELIPTPDEFELIEAIEPFFAKCKQVMIYAGSSASQRISAHLSASQRISAHLSASQRISAHLSASQRISAHLRGSSTRLIYAVHLRGSSTRLIYAVSDRNHPTLTELSVPAHFS